MEYDKTDSLGNETSIIGKKTAIGIIRYEIKILENRMTRKGILVKKIRRGPTLENEVHHCNYDIMKKSY